MITDDAGTAAQQGVKKKGLRYTEVNELVRALRDGKSWDQAKAMFPNVDGRTLDSFREQIEETAAKASAVETKPRPTTEEADALVAEVNRLQGELAEAKAQADKLNGDLAEMHSENTRLKDEINSLLIDDKPTKPKK